MNVVSFSGGKDSTAMLLHMVELGMQIDEIVFCDTTEEFPEMYEHIKKVEDYTGRKITILKAEHSFQYFLFDYEPKYYRNKSVIRHDKGLSFPSSHIRWCTRRLKADIVDKYIKSKIKSGEEINQYIGIAYDEQHRVKDKNYPLVDWKWTEADCLKYCKDRGFDWGGLYDIFSRVSCWCCPLQSLDSLRKLRHNFPELWAKLLDWQHKTWRDFRPDASVDKLEVRFAYEDELGETPRTKSFFQEVNRRLAQLGGKVELGAKVQ